MAHHVERLSNVEAALLGEGHGIRVAHHTRGKRDLVAELGRLTLAGAAHVVDLVREGLKDGQHGRGIALLSAHDEGERARLGTGVATGHGAVEGMLVLDLASVVDVLGELCRGGREVNQVGTLLRGAHQPVRREVDVLDVRGIAKHGEDDVCVGDSLGGGVGPVRALGEEPLGLRLGAVVHREVVAGIQNVAGDRGTHDAGANEGNLCPVGCGHMLGPFM